jgi:hypothetical protein
LIDGRKEEGKLGATYIFSRTIPFDIVEPPIGLAFMWSTECALLYGLLDHLSFLRWFLNLRAARIPDGFLKYKRKKQGKQRKVKEKKEM